MESLLWRMSWTNDRTVVVLVSFRCREALYMGLECIACGTLIVSACGQIVQQMQILSLEMAVLAFVSAT
jgi:hypothetical protein